MIHLCNGEWAGISARQLYSRVVTTARALTQWGLCKGDRVAIMAENRPEWAVVDFACLASGVVDVPIYPTLTAEQAAFILKDSGARVAFVSSSEQLEKLRTVRGETAIEKIVVMDELDGAGIDGSDVVRMSSFVSDGVTGRDAGFDAAAGAITPDDLATIIYTSGTTGTPKGVMLTHGNLAANLVSLQFYDWGEADSCISFLPLSHITARHLDYVCFTYGALIAYCPLFDRLPQTLQEVKPTLFVGVPRVYEKVRNGVEEKIGAGLKRKACEWALEAGKKHRAETLAGKRPEALDWKLADKLLFSKVLGAFGGRTRNFISGGAPLGVRLAEWYADCGIRIHEGYGLTETSPVIAINTPGEHRIATVGKPLPNVEVRTSAEDGEIEVRGPSIFRSYWQNQEETAKAFTADGWFKTGDIGEIDADGYLSITDRKKDLIKTSGGKFIAPQPIEGHLRANVLVAHAAVLGDRRNFPSVIVAPHFPLLESWAQANNVEFHSRGELIAHPKVRAMYDGIVADMNTHLARYEKIKKVLLVPDEFSIATGELTPSLKLKRRVLEQKYKAQIEEMYAGPSPSVTEAASVS
ncbi:MAG: long-chain fatty acid--CoA ligase [Candidatus Koribacter versatilis]|uniref:Long-chain fatty acid--CoA ligase n=1 Tax=Candidatus Korobacter versatilis TaxID=658062 RepID=A0A932EP04_9BACT|nr:long-chain fatty acid--CoA ligase [Candidatus Koribacter versatilis]